MFLSKATEYAIRALIFIKANGQKHTGFREIAKEIGAPEPYTGKVMQVLVKIGILKSSKGPGGGFYIDPAEAPIPLIKVVEAMEGTDTFTKCGLGLKECSAANPCPIHNEFAKIRNQYRDLVSKESIWSMAEKINNGQAVIKR